MLKKSSKNRLIFSLVLSLFLGALFSSSVYAQNQAIYTDSLQNGWGKLVVGDHESEQSESRTERRGVGERFGDGVAGVLFASRRVFDR